MQKLVSHLSLFSQLNENRTDTQEFSNSTVMKILYTVLSLALPIALATTSETVPQVTPPKEPVPEKESTGAPPQQEMLIVGPTEPTKVDLPRVYDLTPNESRFLSSVPSIILPASTLQAPQPQDFFSWVDLIEANKDALEGTTEHETATKLALADQSHFTNDTVMRDMVIVKVPRAVSKSPLVTVKGEDVFVREALPALTRKKHRFSIQMVFGRPRGKEEVPKPQTAAPKETTTVQTAPLTLSEQQPTTA